MFICLTLVLAVFLFIITKLYKAGVPASPIPETNTDLQDDYPLEPISTDLVEDELPKGPVKILLRRIPHKINLLDLLEDLDGDMPAVSQYTKRVIHASVTGHGHIRTPSLESSDDELIVTPPGTPIIANMEVLRMRARAAVAK